MSIKKYCILGILLIFTLLAFSQTVLVLYFKDKVSKDIREQSQKITQTLLGKAKNDLNKQIIRLSSNDSQVVLMTDSMIVDHKTMQKTELPENVKDLVNKIAPDAQFNAQQHIIIDSPKALRDELSSVFVAFDDSDNLQHLIEGEFGMTTQSSSFDEFSTLILWSIVLSSIIAIALAWYFIHLLTRPIGALNSGFQALSEGQFGTQIPSQGVAEIASCITQFNHTSDRLVTLNKAQQQLQQQRHLVELGELSRAIAHSLRNPIHTLGLTLEQFWHSEAAQRVQLQHIAKNKIAHLNKNISALLTLSNTGIERHNPVPINAVIQDIILELTGSAITFETQFTKHISITGLESEVRSILHSVIVNACEATLAHGQHLVQISVEQRHEQVRVRVVDQGAGFDEGILERLFQPHISTKSEGAGMGLYLAQRLMTLYYHGAIDVQNTPNGASVTVNFKLTARDRQ